VTNFWCFAPVTKVAAPAVKDAVWARTDVDHFILGRLEAQGLHPVADADRRTLIRRLYFDLLGLPPSPAQVEAFVADRSDKAWETLVDELLASPHFGERWGRHWLDVARYAESTGKERNHTYPEAWRYRNYVIDALNADVPYDQFIREQIAGDLLPSASPAERDRLTVATGFLAIGPKSINSPRKEPFLMDVVDEQIDVTTRSILGLTVACARCHDHKFDPISQKDYYALAGIFRSTETHYGISEEIQANRQPSTLIPLAASPLAAPTSARLADAGNATRRIRRGMAANAASKRLAVLRANRERELAALAGETNTPSATSSPTDAAPVASAMGVSEGRAVDYPVLIRGEVGNRGPKIPRGFVAVVGATDGLRIPRNESGRLQLAAWLGSKTNPLTARVAVNRIWGHLFGKGLVRTPDDFGAAGATPSHAELLDYLAQRFMDQGWSVKSLVKELVLSHAYALASTQDSAAYAADPDNILLWRMSPRRLDAESIRDAMLAVSGTLDSSVVGGSVVADVGDAFIGAGVRPERFNVLMNTRSIYLPIVRDCVSEALDLFDFAEPSLVVASRDTTTVPAQALYMMNSQFVREQARAFALGLQRQAQDAHQRIQLAYQIALARPPSPAELNLCLAYVKADAPDFTPISTAALRPASSGNAWISLAQALLSSAEFRYLK
jgi:hypothetical protein